MKTKTIRVILPLTFFALFSCRQPGVKKELIETIKSENALYERELHAEIPAKGRLISEKNNSRHEFVIEINPKKKSAFDKDKTVQKQIHKSETDQIEIIDKIQAVSDSLDSVIISNVRFIEALATTELTEKQVMAQWDERKNKLSNIQSESARLLSEWKDAKSSVSEVYKEVLAKYGIPKVIPKKKK